MKYLTKWPIQWLLNIKYIKIDTRNPIHKNERKKGKVFDEACNKNQNKNTKPRQEKW